MAKTLLAGFVSAVVATVMAMVASTAIVAYQLQAATLPEAGGLGVSSGVAEGAVIAAPIGFVIGCVVQARRNRSIRERR